RLWASILKSDAVDATQRFGGPVIVAGLIAVAVAVALLIWSIVYMAAARPSLGERSAELATTPEQYRRSFYRRCLAPLLVSALIFAMLWSWANFKGCGADQISQLSIFESGQVVLCSSSVSPLLPFFLLGGALIHGLAHAWYQRRLAKKDRR